MDAVTEVKEAANKFGWKTVISAIASIAAAMIPLFYAVDGHYAKQKQLDNIDEQIQSLTEQMGNLVGAQQTMLAFMTAHAAHEAAVKSKAAPTPDETAQLSNLNDKLSTTKNALAELKEQRKAVK